MGGTFDEAPFGGSPAQYGLRVGNGGGDVGGACTLLGPEGPGAVAFGLRRLGLLGPSFMPAGAGCGVGTARTLRTTQWTRASLRAGSLIWFVFDDLKDH